MLLWQLALVAVCSPPFKSARSALMADMMEGDRYAVASSLTNISFQLAQVFGFLAAGGLLAVLSPSGALLVDAATFLISALWLAQGLQRRGVPDTEGRLSSVWRHTIEGLQLIGRTPRLLAIIALLWVGIFFAYATEGLATPLIDELDRGTTGLGVLLAANPLGVTVGGLIIARLVRPDLRERLVPFLVVLSLASLGLAGLVAALAGPGAGTFAVFVVLMFVSGLGSAWLIPLNVSFVQAVPSAFRGRAFGVAVTGLNGMQGLGVLAAGLVAEGFAPSVVVALCGAVGLVAVAPPLVAYGRTQGHVAAGAATAGASKA